MERKARILLVSAFLLVSIAALFFFSIWIGDSVEDNIAGERRLQFNGSVSGLSVGSDVRYLGVPMGRVSKIGLSSEYPGRVDVSISVEGNLPPSNSLMAKLEPQGITGLSVVELQNRAAADSATDFGAPQGVIPGYPSVLSQLSASAGEITGSLDQVLAKVNSLLNAQATEDLSVTLSQVRVLANNLAGASGNLEQLISSMSRVSQELEHTLPDYRAVAQRIDGELLPTIVEAGKSFQNAADTVNATIGENKAELSHMIDKELPTLIGITDELARTLQEFNEMVGNINEEPGALLYGEQVQEVEIGLE